MEADAGPARPVTPRPDTSTTVVPMARRFEGAGMRSPQVSGSSRALSVLPHAPGGQSVPRSRQQGYCRRSRISSRTRPASAWPRISFITAPMRAPAAATLPSRIFSATSGLASIARSTASPRAPSSETTARPRAATTSSGVPSPARTPSKTWRASLSLIAPSSTSAWMRGDVGRGDRQGGELDALRVGAAGELGEPPLAADCGEAPAATVSSTSASAPRRRCRASRGR